MAEKKTPLEDFLAQINVGAQAQLAKLRETGLFNISPYYSGTKLVCEMRPKTGPGAGFDGRLTPEDFSAMVGFAWAEGVEVADALRLFLSLQAHGEGRLSRLIVAADAIRLADWMAIRAHGRAMGIPFSDWPGVQSRAAAPAASA